MIRKIHAHFKNDTFLKNNIIFFLSSLLVAFLNYLYYPILSRMLSVEQFGEIQTIFSFVFLSTVILTVFRMIILDVTKNDTTHSKEELISTLFTVATIFHLPIFLILIFFSTNISTFFSFRSEWGFAVFSLYLLISIPFTFYNSHLQGKSNFISLSISNIILSVSKIIFSVFLVLLGFKVFGAIGGLILSTLTAIMYTKTKTLSMRLYFQKDIKLIRDLIAKEKLYTLLILSSLLFVTFLYSGDVLVIKHFFNPEVAGMYGGIATIARSIFFVTTSISAVLISAVNINNPPEKNKKIFFGSLKLVSILGGMAALVFILFPKFTINLLIGKNYLDMYTLLPTLSVLLFLISILNLFISYLLALRSKILMVISFVSLLMLMLLLKTNNHSPIDIVYDFIIVTVFTLILLIYKIIK